VVCLSIELRRRLIIGVTAGEVDEYLHSKLGLPNYFEDDLLAEAKEKAIDAGIPDIAVSAMQGQFLNILCKSIGASRILEIGTLWG
jgi:predicted O-methyltransferase YrrM